MSCYSFSGAWQGNTVSFTTSRSRVCLRASLSTFWPPRSSCHLMLPSLMLLMNALPSPPWMWSLCSTGKEQWILCSMVVANSYRGSSESGVLAFGWVWYAAARFWSPNRFSIVPIISTCVAPLRTLHSSSEALPCRTVKRCMALIRGTHS
jgi:hypothetical protein